MIAPDASGAAAGQPGMPIMHDFIDRLATEYLPEELYANIQANEHRNFVSLVEAVEALAAVIPDARAACSNQAAVLAADPLLQQITTYETSSACTKNNSRVV